mmetsp:Transcript_108563/g.302749  ORF Transcript_108563/g.302749 Transcript_108563/m.302749 type:complete len:208 (-) Transcript_108563:247-870(-)
MPACSMPGTYGPSAGAGAAALPLPLPWARCVSACQYSAASEPPVTSLLQGKDSCRSSSSSGSRISSPAATGGPPPPDGCSAAGGSSKLTLYCCNAFFSGDPPSDVCLFPGSGGTKGSSACCCCGCCCCAWPLPPGKASAGDWIGKNDGASTRMALRKACVRWGRGWTCGGSISGSAVSSPGRLWAHSVLSGASAASLSTSSARSSTS